MQVKDTDSEVVEALGMSSFPALVVITPDGELVQYEGVSIDNPLVYPSNLILLRRMARVLHLSSAMQGYMPLLPTMLGS